jgi:hypothetical protein
MAAPYRGFEGAIRGLTLHCGLWGVQRGLPERNRARPASGPAKRGTHKSATGGARAVFAYRTMGTRMASGEDVTSERRGGSK